MTRIAGLELVAALLLAMLFCVGCFAVARGFLDLTGHDSPAAALAIGLVLMFALALAFAVLVPIPR